MAAQNLPSKTLPVVQDQAVAATSCLPGACSHPGGRVGRTTHPPYLSACTALNPQPRWEGPPHADTPLFALAASASWDAFPCLLFPSQTRPRPLGILRTLRSATPGLGFSSEHQHSFVLLSGNTTGPQAGWTLEQAQAWAQRVATNLFSQQARPVPPELSEWSASRTPRRLGPGATLERQRC